MAVAHDDTQDCDGLLDLLRRIVQRFELGDVAFGDAVDGLGHGLGEFTHVGF